MINVNDIIKDAVQRKASDIHFISGLKPMLRINRDLLSVENADIISDDDMWDIYDFFLSGNVDRDKLFREKKVLDCSVEVGDVRLRVNVSYSNSVPVITTRIIRNSLPRYEDLGVPDIVRRMTEQPQGLILVTGKTNSGKSTTLNALINYINETQNRKILTLESPVEYRHKSKKSIIIQKEVGVGGDVPTYSIGTKNSLREDCDILVIGEIRDKETMDAAIETAESGHLVIGTLHTKSCAETIDRMINFYEVSDQATIKYMIASILKLVISQRLIKNKRGTLTLIPEVMVVDNVIAGIIRKDKLSVSEIEDAIQSSSGNGNIGLINSLAELFVKDEITLDQAKAQIEEKNVEILNRTIMQLKIKKQEESNQKSNNAYGMY
jgi:twitching motility protein PilT